MFFDGRYVLAIALELLLLVGESKTLFSNRIDGGAILSMDSEVLQTPQLPPELQYLQYLQLVQAEQLIEPTHLPPLLQQLLANGLFCECA